MFGILPGVVRGRVKRVKRTAPPEMRLLKEEPPALPQRRSSGFWLCPSYRSNCWLPREAFMGVLRRERHRTDHTGSPFSLLIFELRKGSGVGKPEFWEVLKRTITSQTRDYDVRVELDPQRLGVLLLDTPAAQGRVLAARILARLRESAKEVDITTCLRGVRVSSYPASSAQGYERMELILPPPNGRGQAEVHTSYHSEAPSLETHHSPAVWNVSCDPLGVAVVDTPLFLDLDAYYDTAYQVAKRALDIIGAAVGLVVTAPLWLVIALLVKLTSPGPVFFRQERVGHRGKHFHMLKFRTMRVGCDDSVHREYVKRLIEGKDKKINFGTEQAPVYKLVNDPRVTPVGRLLRRTSLDELPQLINVLLGQMSLVGPRPPLPFEVESYRSWHLRRILEAKPGITGLWQVYGRSSTTFDQMVRMDLQYAMRRSLWLDLKLIVKTFTAVFSTSGAL